MPEQRRTSLEIMIDLLEGIRQQGYSQVPSTDKISINKRQLMRSANLNYSQLTRYLDTLEEKGFIEIEETDSEASVEITASGEQFLRRANTLSDLLAEDGPG